MKPFVNLDELKEFEEHEDGPFKEKCAGISEKIGAKKLSYSVTIIPPGKKVCPFHNHHINEELFLIIEGRGLLRFGDNEYPIKKNDVIACPPGGREVAHQILNNSDSDLKYFCLSTKIPHDICEYPDSDKIMAMARHDGGSKFRHISRVQDAVSYMDGETSC